MTTIKNFILLLKAQKSDDLQDKFETTFQERGYVVKQVKTLDFSYINLKELTEKLNDPDSYSGIIFSSPRCVHSTNLALGVGKISEEWKLKQNFVVGQTTYELALQDLGLDCEGRETGNANNLSEIIIKDQDKYVKPFLFPHGNLKMDILKSRLFQTQITLDEVLVYETITNPDVYQEFRDVTNDFCHIPEYVVFFSPSGVGTVLNFLDQLPLDKMKLVAIGPTTQKAMEDKELDVFDVADRPTPESLLDILK